jgi:hypothetical protein
MPPPEKREWKDKINRSGFFVGAVLLHVVVFLLVATWVVIQAPPKEPDAKFKWTGPAPKPTPPVTSPPTDPTPNAPPVASTADTSAHLNPIISIDPRILITLPPVGAAGVNPGESTIPFKTIAPSSKGLDPKRAKAIGDFISTYRPPGQIQSGDLEMTFPIYVASYADGDWACNLHLDGDGNIVAGSLPDLSAKITEWTHGKVKGLVERKPLNIASSELHDKKPPFIFFTGHKDFHLTDKEVENLQAYVMQGGMIWGDNALAGAGSRFDVAFRREMKRVIPDIDAQFQPVSMDSEIFTKEKFRFAEVPKGMNNYTEPLEHLDIDGYVAVLYTPNDYSDMLDLRILPDNVTQQLPYAGMPAGTLFTEPEFWSRQHVYYRNFSIESSLAVHRLGMNIVTYLLTRFDDKLLLTP